MKPSSLVLLVTLTAIVRPSAAQSNAPEKPTANPGRPTVATPATLTPVGYLQFETGYLGATHSPQFSSRYSLNEVVKLSVASRIELLALIEPFARSNTSGAAVNNGGDFYWGVQGVIYPGEGAKPTLAVSFARHGHDGGATDFDIGSPTNVLTLLASADVKKFHFDGNVFFNELEQNSVRRGQFGQTLSVSHPLTKQFGLTGELWHFTQPFLKANAIGSLWALTYAPRGNLVLDVGFNRGLTTTSTRWEVFAGFTYLLPHRLWKAH